MEHQGAHTAAAAQTAALATRAAKTTVPDLATLREQWRSRAHDIGVDADLLSAALNQGPVDEPDPETLSAELLAPSGVTANSSTFDRRHIIQAIATAHLAGARVQHIRRAADRVLRQPQIVALGAPGPVGQLYSTAELLRIEQHLVDTAARRITPAARHSLSPDQVKEAIAARPTLSEEQKTMVRSITTSDAAVQVVVGRAGTGKTFALDAARDLWRSAGRTVIGTALSARAAAELQAGAGIASTTLDRLLTDVEHPGPLSALTSGTVVVVDEAGMVGTRKLARLVDHAVAHNATVVLVGDPRQLPEINAGGAFAALAGRVATVELTENRRQRETWERQALAQLRAGSVPVAVDAYSRRGRITLAPTHPKPENK